MAGQHTCTFIALIWSGLTLLPINSLFNRYTIFDVRIRSSIDDDDDDDNDFDLTEIILAVQLIQMWTFFFGLMFMTTWDPGAY